VWLNELHGDYLAYDRLAERRRWLAGGLARVVRLLF